MNAMHRLVRRVTESLPVARGSVGIRICCYGRSIWVIWCGIEPRFAEFRADGDIDDKGGSMRERCRSRCGSARVLNRFNSHVRLRSIGEGQKDV